MACRRRRTTYENCSIAILHLLKLEHGGTGAREAKPIECFRFQILPAEPRERVEFGAAVVVGDAPFRGDQPGVLELVECGIERSVTHLERIGGDLTEPVPDRPSVHGLEGEHLEDEHVESALDEVIGLAHAVSGRLPTLAYGESHPRASRRYIMHTS